MCHGVQVRVVLASTAALLAIALTTSACGGGSSGGGVPSPSSSRVFLVIEENHSYSEVIGNSAMSFVNGLASKYGIATQYYADTHPSIGNYFMLTTGKIESNDDSFSGTISDDNIVRELVKANKTWRSYAENLPSPGYLGGDAYPYLRHHNPFTYFSDVIGSRWSFTHTVPNWSLRTAFIARPTSRVQTEAARP